MIGAYPQKVQIMDGATAFAAAPVLGTDLLTFYSALGCKGLILHCDINDGTTFSLTFTIKRWSSLAAEATTTILASAARTTNAPFDLSVYPGLTETANVDASALLGEYFQVAITGTTDTAKIKIVAELIP